MSRAHEEWLAKQNWSSAGIGDARDFQIAISIGSRFSHEFPRAKRFMPQGEVGAAFQRFLEANPHLVEDAS